jgi:flagellin
MSLVINTNIASLTAQKNLSSNQTALNTSLERLSSGLRINSAKDDAAGLAISNRFTTQINGLNQAVQNSQDGISLSQTAEGALQEVTNNLQRIRTLAVQSANATNSASDRTAIDGEVQQRISEITRIASQTTFNSQNILNGTLGTVQFQVGADVGQTISVGLTTNVAAGAIGSYVSQSGAQTANALTTVAGTSGTATQATTAAVPAGTLTTNTFGASPATAYAGVSSAAFTNGSFTINGSGVLDSSGANFVGPSTGQSSDSAYAKAAARRHIERKMNNRPGVGHPGMRRDSAARPQQRKERIGRASRNARQREAFQHFGGIRAALDHGAGGHLQLHHAGTRPAVAHF